MKKITLLILITALCGNISASAPLRDEATEELYAALKRMTDSGYTMFGMANAYTIGYNHNKKQITDNLASSDVREVTGDNPAFVESDLMWYNDKDFMAADILAMKQAHARGAVLGYCWHLVGMRSAHFAVNEGGEADRELAALIVANPDRSQNAELDWFLTLLDTLAIPVFRELDFPLVFRPFHEMTGEWFWWGSGAGQETYKKLFRLTVDYLREAGISNLLYCWSPDKDADFGYYPGDDYVDILGYDAYEPGLMPYCTSELLTREIARLIDYADSHDKVVAWTEVGVRTLPGAEKYSYPTLVPDFWTKYVWNAVKNDPRTSRLAWVMSWYNADWKNDGSGAPFVPYAGMDKEGSEAAVLDFQKLYHTNNALFEGQLPPIYSGQGREPLFVRPLSPVMRVGESLVMLGGDPNNWYKDDKALWQSSDESVASVDVASGRVLANAPGSAIISVHLNGKTASARLTVH